jgi:preprotein translocase subunit SecD
MINRYPLWKYLLLIGMIIFGLIYALPNIFGEDPAVQISPKSGFEITNSTISQVQGILEAESIPYLNINRTKDGLLVRFPSADSELKAKDLIHSTLGDNYIVAVNLAPRTPRWLQAIGAQPMKLGLDLQGGVNFLLQVDVNSVIKARLTGDMNNFGTLLRQHNIRYANMLLNNAQGIVVHFHDSTSQDEAYSLMMKNFNDYIFAESSQSGDYTVTATLSPTAAINLTNYSVEQDISILNNRVNELGVSEAAVQRQGKDLISVDMPGVQDTARAKELLGKTATLKFQLVDVNGDVASAQQGTVPLGDTLYT